LNNIALKDVTGVITFTAEEGGTKILKGMNFTGADDKYPLSYVSWGHNGKKSDYEPKCERKHWKVPENKNVIGLYFLSAENNKELYSFGLILENIY
jgi:hypothetical protein